MRGSVCDLQQTDPALAERYNKLRDELDSPKALGQVAQRYVTGQRLEKLIQEIRGLPGLERFLLAPFRRRIQVRCNRGSNCCHYVSDHRSDA